MTSWRMSSGSSAFSIKPPKIDRNNRLSLFHIIPPGLTGHYSSGQAKHGARGVRWRISTPLQSIIFSAYPRNSKGLNAPDCCQRAIRWAVLESTDGSAVGGRDRSAECGVRKAEGAGRKCGVRKGEECLNPLPPQTLKAPQTLHNSRSSPDSRATPNPQNSQTLDSRTLESPN